jgi:hypothetical protein
LFSLAPKTLPTGFLLYPTEWRYPVSHSDTFDTVAYLNHLSCEFMPHDKTGAAEYTLFIGVQIRAADSAGFHFDQDICRLYFGPFNVLYAEISSSVKNRCFHDSLKNALKSTISDKLLCLESPPSQLWEGAFSVASHCSHLT